MPEGLSPSQVGKEISELRARVAEEEEKGKEGSATEAKGRDRVITIIEAVLLAVVAVLAAYSGFAAAKCGTESRSSWPRRRRPGRRRTGPTLRASS